MSLAEAAVLLIFFAEPGFPTAGLEAGPIAEARVEAWASEPPPGVLVVRDVASLVEVLRPGRVLVWRHGGAYPAEAWPVIERFLADGGSLLHLGGPVFSHPVEGSEGFRRRSASQVSVAKQLGLNPGGSLSVAGATMRSRFGGSESSVLPEKARVFHLEPRFSSRKRRPDEEGSPGLREARLIPLRTIHLARDEPRFPAATASMIIDRLDGRYAGGRWTLRLLSTAPTDDEFRELLAWSREAPFELSVEPTTATFHEEEKPSVVVRLQRPAEWAPREARSVALEWKRPGGTWVALDAATIPAGASTRAVVSLTDRTPGLHLVRARIGAAPGEAAESGFWIFDREVFEGGPELSIDRELIRWGGVPQVGVGTTVMSRSVHRNFLEKPNPAEWDDTFGELASLGVRWVRTGIWSGWGDFVEQRGVQEDWLRALEAYCLCAQAHGIGVIFTFFTFTPYTFEGSSPYFDPKVIARQAGYLSTVAERFRGFRGIIWDFINEPSFANPQRHWFCRPNGDKHERRAFFHWLETTFEPEGPRTWQDVVRERWRLRPDEPITVPTEADFQDAIVFGEARPYRARDYIRFAQYHFTDWAATMRFAIEKTGASQPMTVGQDEGGLNDRPSPLVHEAAIDFTSIHTWWYNDAQLWDVAMSRVPGKPCWVTETLLMRREDLSGEIFRTTEMREQIFARKLALPFAAGATQVLTWAYDVNPYMDSDNEVSIGLRRADGSYTPEHRVFREFAAGFRGRAARFANPAAPTVTLLLPSHDHRSPRDLQREGTKRLVQILFELGHRVMVVLEEHPERLPKRGPIIVPSCRGLREEAWQALLARDPEAGPIITSGWFEQDDVGHPAKRFGLFKRGLAAFEAVGERQLAFPLDRVQSSYAAVSPFGEARMNTRPGGWVERLPGIWHHLLPIDGGRGPEVIRDLYRAVLPAGRGAALPPGQTVTELSLEGAPAWVVVNVSRRPLHVVLRGVEIRAKSEGAAIVWRTDAGALEVRGIGVTARLAESGQLRRLPSIERRHRPTDRVTHPETALPRPSESKGERSR